ncbi:MAG: methylmalonate-semialdehyde dehydrogenase (CoA acylating) [Planctomycetes bacterium]|jgi:malonate-semialdehyde dehydrogenase (acetylating)/methylmalonate-semialdehyde dehydrogenase|nr:methylmalonate-semialdehyde dehydrogenase (CoA acylating) [Planctomycetota bacterium]MDP6409568.1 CoA-acylating methylmalonate-semialdehyde dehydrogenase [Planctomycetota bacterium]
MTAERLQNHIDGAWIDSDAAEVFEVTNPASGEVIGLTPLCGGDEVDAAVRAAARAYPDWRRTPVEERIQPLFRLKALLEEHAEELATIVTRENGKTLAEARGSVRRGIQMIEVACGAPTLLMGQALEDIAGGIDCESVRQPLGVFACIAPFNFPAMVPMWFFPFAVACGNTFVSKPSEQVPFSQDLVWRLIDEAGFPPGVLNLVHGGREAVDTLVEHPLVRGVSFVGSSPVAEHVYKTAAVHGKRVQALGGAKNFVIVMPDADMELTVAAIADSAFGCAGERCLAASIVLTVGDCHDEVRAGLERAMAAIEVGDGTREGVTLGPLISAAHKRKVEEFIAAGAAEGAELVLDGRETQVDGLPGGFFLGPTLFDGVTPAMSIGSDEIFGPVLCLMHTENLESALEITREQPLANASSIFTTSGKHARTFRYEIEASMAGVNIGVAAPMAFFGFGGAKGSFFGDLKAHGREAFDFFTDRKVVISRW